MCENYRKVFCSDAWSTTLHGKLVQPAPCTCWVQIMRKLSVSYKVFIYPALHKDLEHNPLPKTYQKLIKSSNQRITSWLMSQSCDFICDPWNVFQQSQPISIHKMWSRMDIIENSKRVFSLAYVKLIRIILRLSRKVLRQLQPILHKFLVSHPTIWRCYNISRFALNIMQLKSI